MSACSGSSGQGAQGGVRGGGGAALGGGGSRDVAVRWGKKAGSPRRPHVPGCSGHGPHSRSQTAVPPGPSPQPRLPPSPRPARQPWAEAQHLGCPACPRRGAAALCKAAFSLRPNISPEQRGPGVGGPLPLARGALLRPRHRLRGQAPPSSEAEQGSRRPPRPQFPACPADSGLTPRRGPCPAAPGPTEPVLFLRDQGRQPDRREHTLGRREGEGLGPPGRLLAPQPRDGAPSEGPQGRLGPHCLTPAPAEGHEGARPRPGQPGHRWQWGSLHGGRAGAASTRP